VIAYFDTSALIKLDWLCAIAVTARLEVWATGWQPSGRFVVECRPA